MKSKTSKVLSVGGAVRKIKAMIGTLKDDRVDLYAAESAFYIMLSAIPFLLLLFTAARLVIPDGISEYLYGFAEKLPDGIGDYVKEEIASLSKRPTPAPFSLTAASALWSASRGVKAVRRGIYSVYGGDISEGNYLKDAIRGIFFTAVFVILITAVLVFLVFGSTLRDIVSSSFPSLCPLFDAAVMLSPIFFSVFLALFFAFVLSAFTPREIHLLRRDHYAGALAATVGWILYSYLFSVFVNEFSEMSYIYGGLTALMLLCLWLYMIMYILLFGAEINKYLFIKRTLKSKKRPKIE